jgi:hypothetical protein
MPITSQCMLPMPIFVNRFQCSQAMVPIPLFNLSRQALWLAFCTLETLGLSVFLTGQCNPYRREWAERQQHDDPGAVKSGQAAGQHEGVLCADA